VQAVTLLLEAGADVNAVEPTFGAVPLHKAVYNGHVDSTRIIAGRPGVDLNFQGATNGYSPLHDALWHGYDECARILVEAGADLDLVGHDGKTPLALATEVLGAGHPVTELIAAKAAS
jgi:ankyrin repeat protein